MAKATKRRTTKQRAATAPKPKATKTKGRRVKPSNPGFTIAQLDEKDAKLYAAFLNKLKVQKRGNAAGKVAEQIKEQLIGKLAGATVGQFPDGSAIVVTEHVRDMAPLPAKRITWKQINPLGS